MRGKNEIQDAERYQAKLEKPFRINHFAAPITNSGATCAARLTRGSDIDSLMRRLVGPNRAGPHPIEET